MYWPILLILSFSILASEETILRIPLPQPGRLMEYKVDIQKCKIMDPFVKKAVNHGELNILEDFYYSVSTKKYTEDEIQFQFQMAKNLMFTYRKNAQTCDFELFVKWEDSLEKVEKIHVNYYQRLGVPTLKTLTITTEDFPKSKQFRPYEFVGYLPFYEFNVGLAANIHSNIRPNEKRRFNRWDPVVEPIPTFLIRYGPLFVNNDGAGSVILPLEYFTLLATFLLEGEPYQSDFIRNRKKSLYFGPLLKIKWLELLYYKDIREISYGEVLKITLAPTFEFTNTWTFNPRVFWQYWDDEYVDYYFGVNGQEAQALGIESYATSETKNYGFMFRNVLKYKRWNFVASTGMKFYGKEVDNSPLTIRDNEFRLILGFLYNLF